MPIGKNAIKRVENNGYSKVKTAAPDMENSSVITKPDEQVVEKMIAPVEKATAAKTAKKSTAKKAPAKSKCFLVAGRGLEPPDLRVMSPTSYQLLYPAI